MGQIDPSSLLSLHVLSKDGGAGMDLAVSRSRWQKRGARNHRLLLSASLILLAVLLLFISSYAELHRSLLPPSDTLYPQRTATCGRDGDGSLAGERFLWYAPHSGFSNQLSELKNALLLAGVLNRTLIVPAVLDHHAVALGSCPKFRVTSPAELRAAVWDHIMELARSGRYISMADIINLSSIRSMVKTIDFRVFASVWCSLNMENTCFGSLCCSLSRARALSGSFHQCRSLLSGLDGDGGGCVHAVDDDCRTTVWTYKQNNNGILDSFQPDEDLRRKKKISYVRKRRDVYKAFGPGSKAEKATVLAFGSVFSAPYKGSELYIDIHDAPRDFKIQSLLKKIEFLPFTPEIKVAGKEFAVTRIKEPFLCAQLRLLDGQFKNHWKATFSAIKEKIQSLQLELKENKANSIINIFIMTDLPAANWSGTYLAELAKNTSSFKLHTLQANDESVVETAKRLMTAEHGLRSGFLPKDLNGKNTSTKCDPVVLPDILLYIEESVCSCASLGFVGTAGSTIAESIELMRNNNYCLQ